MFYDSNHSPFSSLHSVSSARSSPLIWLYIISLDTAVGSGLMTILRYHQCTSNACVRHGLLASFSLCHLLGEYLIYIFHLYTSVLKFTLWELVGSCLSMSLPSALLSLAASVVYSLIFFSVQYFLIHSSFSADITHFRTWGSFLRNTDLVCTTLN